MERLSELNKAGLPQGTWQECKNKVMEWVFTDRTTSQENLKEKARNYALNWMREQQEVPILQREVLATKMADEIEKDLKDHPFDSRPPASVAAQAARERIPEEPDKKFIKLR